MAFNTALSGLRAANADLSITGNNIANASTVGFKNSRAEFGDIYATSILGAGANTIGSGVRLQNVAQQFSQGNVSFTENALDLAISGSGFFVLNNGGDQTFSRAGTLGLDKDGFITNNVGATLQGFQADSNGIVSGVLGDLQIQTGNQPPRQTTQVESTLNLDATEQVLQSSGTTFVTTGNAIGVSQVGAINDTTSTLLSGTFNLPLLNDFNNNNITFDVQLSGASANNGTVSVQLDNAAGVPPSVNTFNDLRTMAGVINSQLFSPTVNGSQDPIDVLAVAVDDGLGDYHLEFQSLIPGESSQVSVTNGSSASTAVSDQAGVSFSSIGVGSPVDFSAIDPPLRAIASATTTISAADVDTAAAGGASTVSLVVNGTTATIDLNAAAVNAAAVTGGAGNDDVNELVTQINALIAGTGLAGAVQAVNNSAPAAAGSVRFETTATGINQSLIVSAITGNDFLGLATPLGQTNTGDNGATFDISVNGNTPVTVSLGGMVAQTSLGGLETALDTVLDTAVGSNLVDAHFDATTGQLYFESVGTGAANTVQVTSVSGTDILGLQGVSGSTNLVNAVFRGGDSAQTLGLPLGGGRISDSSGQAAVSNGYPSQSIDVVDPDGTAITYTALEGNSAAETASEMNALSGVSATATTTATLSAYGNANGNGVLTINNVALTGDTLPELETQINALTTSTLPGITAIYDATAGVLSVTSAVGDDLTVSFSSTDDGDSITVQGDLATVSTVLESDPLNNGTSTATVAQTPSGNTVLTGSENWWGQTPAPSFDISIDGQGFTTVNLQDINNDLLTQGTTPVASATADAVVGTPVNSTFDVAIAGTVTRTETVDLNGFVDGSALTPAALQAQMQSAVDSAFTTTATVLGTNNTINNAAIVAAGGGAAQSINVDVNGTTVNIDMVAASNAAVAAVNPAPATVDDLITQINAALGGLTGQIVAVNDTGAVRFDAVTSGATQTITLESVGIDFLGFGGVGVPQADAGVGNFGDVLVNLNPVTNELSLSTGNSGAAETILLSNVVPGGTGDLLGLTSIATAMGGAPDAGAAASIPATVASVQSAVDAAVGAGNVTVAADVSGQLYFETALPGINHSLSITNVTNDVLGLSSVPNLVGGVYQGADGTNNRAEGANGNSNAIIVGGAVDIVLDEGFTVTDPNPPAIGLFGPFTASTFEPFIINEFDPLDQASYNHATSVNIYDSLGNSHIMTEYFVKQPYDTSDPSTSQNHWLMYVLIDGEDVGDPITTLAPPDNTLPTRASYDLHFNQDGSLNEFLSDEVLISNWEPLDENGQPNGALGSQNQLQGGTLPIPEPPSSSNFEIDLEGTSQFGSDFAINDIDQNGFTTGRLSGISIDDEGIIFARFTNGEAQTLGQIALAEFANDQGLQPVGNTMWAENFESGVANIGVPGTAALGVIQAGAVEESNVDLSSQLVNLIIAQRNFQANAKTIETANQTTQTIINLR
jgi:flagellar hook protein FlgE